MSQVADRTRKVAAGVAAVAVAALTGGCSSTHRTIDPDSAAQQIAGQLAAVYHVPAPEVICPAGVPATRGRTFTCSTALDDQLVHINATVTGTSGRFTATPADPILVMASVSNQLEQEIKTRTGQPATVRCPAPPLQVVPVGRTVSCSATFSGEQPRTVTVKVVDQRGDFGFQLAPPAPA